MAETALSSKRPILIVERDAAVCALQTHFLHRAGYEVVFVQDGESALGQARAIQPLLVVTEILIPKLDGLALCRRLTSDPATAAVPVVIFSILSAEARAREAGAKAFLRKPFIETTFLATVRDVTGGHSNDPGLTT
jgi:CheY-like chemotaxis protein